MILPSKNRVETAAMNSFEFTCCPQFWGVFRGRFIPWDGSRICFRNCSNGSGGTFLGPGR